MLKNGVCKRCEWDKSSDKPVCNVCGSKGILMTALGSKFVIPEEEHKKMVRQMKKVVGSGNG